MARKRARRGGGTTSRPGISGFGRSRSPAIRPASGAGIEARAYRRPARSPTDAAYGTPTQSTQSLACIFGRVGAVGLGHHEMRVVTRCHRDVGRAHHAAQVHLLGVGARHRTHRDHRIVDGDVVERGPGAQVGDHVADLGPAPDRQVGACPLIRVLPVDGDGEGDVLVATGHLDVPGEALVRAAPWCRRRRPSRGRR